MASTRGSGHDKADREGGSITSTYRRSVRRHLQPSGTLIDSPKQILPACGELNLDDYLRSTRAMPRPLQISLGRSLRIEATWSSADARVKISSSADGFALIAVPQIHPSI